MAISVTEISPFTSALLLRRSNIVRSEFFQAILARSKTYVRLIINGRTSFGSHSMAHARRHFTNALKANGINPKKLLLKSSKGDRIAIKALSFFETPYTIERRIREASPDERHRIRCSRSSSSGLIKPNRESCRLPNAVKRRPTHTTTGTGRDRCPDSTNCSRATN